MPAQPLLLLILHSLGICPYFGAPYQVWEPHQPKPSRGAGHVE